MVLKTDFQRSDENSQDPLNENFTEIDKYIKDTGWLTLTLTSSFRPYGGSTSNSPKYRKIGKSVEIKGIIQPTSVINSGGTGVIATLPDGFKPSGQAAMFICHGSDKKTWLATIDTNGSFGFGRYGDSSNAEASTNVWLPFTIRYFVD